MSTLDAALEEIAHLREQLRVREEELNAARASTELFKAEYERLARQIFGRRSERLDGQDPAQLTLLNDPGADDRPEFPPPPRPKKGRRSGRRGGGGRKSLAAHLPRVEVTSSESAPATCPCCGEDTVVIGEDRSERLERIPAQYRVLVVVREKRVCQKCPDAGVLTQPAPPFGLQRSKYADGFVAQVLVDKYADNIPLRRQVTRCKRENLDVPVANLCRIVKRSADLLRHVVRVMAADLIAGGFIQGDGTGFPILDGPRNDKINGALWVYTDGDQAVFEATKTHEGRHAAAFLDGFEGVFLPDGASTYNEATRPEAIARAGCWAHARRKFFDARKNHAAAFTALRRIRELFLMEREAWTVDAEARQRIRQERAVPWLATFRAFLDEHLKTAEPRSPWHGALKYADNQWARLNVFVDHPSVPIHNNASELALRGPVTGRKNWLFAGSEGGADAAAVHFSIIHSCMLAGVDPYAYLRDILHRLPDATPTALRQMTPRAWASREHAFD
jgi:transposase